MNSNLPIVKLAGLLVLGVFIAWLIPTWGAPVRAPQAQEKQQADIEPLMREMLSAQQSGGERGLRAWMKANKGRVGAAWIVRLAERGAKEREQDWIEAALVLAEEKKDKSCLANVNMTAGDFSFETWEYDRALELYEAAVRLYRDLGDLAGQAKAERSEGSVHIRTGDQARAQECFGRALPIFHALGDAIGEARTLNGMGLSYFNLGEPEKALEQYERALSIERAGKDLVNEAKTLGFMAVVYWGLGEMEKALEYYEQELPIRRAVGDRVGEASALMGIGLTYYNLGELPKALECYQQALPILRASNDRLTEARTLQNMGNVYSALGEPAKALEYYEQALPIERAVSDRVAEAMTLSNIGEIYGTLGELAKALGYYEQALPVGRAAGDPRIEAKILNDLGRTYSDLGESAKALEYCGLALLKRRDISDRAGEAETLDNMGCIQFDLGEFAKALEYFRQALPIRRDVGDRAGEAVTLTGIGNVHACLGEPAKALEHYRQALLIERDIGYQGYEASTLSNMGNAYSDLREQAKALECYEQALPAFRAVGYRAGEANTLENLMALHRDLGHQRLAVFFGKRSVNLCQELRAAIRTLEKDTQRTYLKTIESSYRMLADILAGQGRLGEAQQVLGLLKEEEYFEFVRRDAGVAKQLRGRADLTPAEQTAMAQYEDVADKVTSVGRRVEELRAMRSRDADQEAELVRLKADLTAAAKAFQVVLRQVEDDLGGPRSRGARDVVQELQATRGLGADVRSLGGDVVVLSTVVAEKAVWVILTTPTTQVAGRTEIEAPELNRKVMAFREVLADLEADPRPLARDLFNILIKPVEKDLDGAAPKTIAWALDAGLRYLPVSALYDGKRYLVERFASVELTLASMSRLAMKPSAAWRALGFGVTEAHEGFEALPGVADELKAVVQDESEKDETNGALPGRRLLDRNFTKRALEEGRAESYPVLHIASHFVFQPGNATDSFLLLGDGSHLTVEDIRTNGEALFLGVELLTLSACETAMSGERGDGREVEGLGVEAQNQGAQAVLATLWPVEDKSTAELMAGFYRLRQGQKLSKAEALRDAQLTLLKRGYAHPYFWAPFILMGNWR